MLADEVVGIRPAKNELATDLARRPILRRRAVQPKAKHFIFNQALLHHVVEHRLHLVHGDVVEPETEYTVELRKQERDPRLFRRFGEVLPLDDQVADFDFVLGQKSAQRAASVLNRKRRPIRLVRLRRSRIELCVQVARNLQKSTLRARHPEVRASGVEDDLELLSRVADFNLPVILRIHVIVYIHAPALRRRPFFIARVHHPFFRVVPLPQSLHARLRARAPRRAAVLRRLSLRHPHAM